ncbi:MAG: sulfate ABC transporter permease subunit CysT [Dehalococcoidia bacterium]|nr:sulfate ABC transporter permease subunit CysT [Dehalococcoidia bacterium]
MAVVVAPQQVPIPKARGERPWGAWGLRTIALVYLALMIVVPLSAVVAEGLSGGLGGLWHDLNKFSAQGALFLTLWTGAIMTVINVVMGTLTAYVLVRYQFPGKALLNAIIDMPVAIPTLVSGLMLVILLGPQEVIGKWLDAVGIHIIFNWPAIVIALLFTTFPLVVRAVQPVLEELEIDQEEAAYSLGATQWQTFRHVMLPALRPAVISGGLLTFARALGEFGSIVLVAGNLPGKTLTAPVYILGEIESGSPRSASAMSLVLLTISFVMIILLDWLQRRRMARRD